MRVRGTGRGLKTLSRFALIGVIGGGAAACSSDASRLGDPFGNPFSASTNEPAATGSLPEEGRSAPIRTGRIDSEALGSPNARMSPRPGSLAAAAPMTPATRVASTEPTGMASGMNPDAGRTMTTRAAAPPMTIAPKAIDKAAEKRAAEAARESARKAAEAEKLAEDKKLSEARRLVADRKIAEAKAQKDAEAAKKVEASKKHVRPGQAVAKADVKAEKPVRKIEIKAEVKAEPKGEKPDAAKAKAEATRKASEAEAKLARAEAAKEAAKDAAKKVAETKAAEAAAKAAPVKVAAVAPEKVEPASTGSVAPAAQDHSFRWPAKGRVIAGYGSSGNEGINIAMPEGTPVKAAEDGTVAYAGSDVKGYGKLVLVRHTNGYVSAYAHNGELDVRPGEKVKRGQTIAKSGATGNVTSPQLHFEIRKGATPVDPMPHLASN